MIEQPIRIEQTRELHPAAHLFLKSDVFNASVASVCAFVVSELLFGIVFEMPFPMVSKIAAGIVAFIFFVVIVLRVGHITAPLAVKTYTNIKKLSAIKEAQLELFLDRDLNHSGAKGDVDQKYLPATVNESTRVEHHFVNTNIPKEHHVVPGKTGDVLLSHVREFVEQIPVRGIERNSWVANKKTLGYQFKDQMEITRDEYESVMEMLIQAHVVKGRGQGVAGRVVYPPDAILSLLGIGGTPYPTDGNE